MLKEIFIALYLTIFKFVFSICSLFPQKNKIVLIVSFTENACYLQQEMVREKIPYEIIALCKPSLQEEFQEKLKGTTIIPFESPNLLNWCKSIYHLSTAKCVVIDNYFGFLSAITFRENVECIQVWHAVGALKTFGLKDKTIKNRSKKANQRFRRVYDKFDKIVVGSEEMASIFRKSFNLPAENILRIGIPRTDFFYEEKLHGMIRLNFEEQNPNLKGKKLILYAPTFRDAQLENYQIHLDIKKMYLELGSEYCLLIKLHPAVKTNQNVQELYPNFVYDFSTYSGINELLVVVDYLITDYSSIPFEFALLKKPMVFFPYDLEFYQRERGVIQNYEKEVPGPVGFKTEEIIKWIKSNNFDIDKICEFSSKWNEYSNGKSSENLVHYILTKID